MDEDNDLQIDFTQPQKETVDPTIEPTHTETEQTEIEPVTNTENTNDTSGQGLSLLEQMRINPDHANQLLSMFGGLQIRDYKLILIVRMDLKMGRGKIAAQCSHATLGAYLNTENSEETKRWLSKGAAKVVVKCETEEEMDLIRDTARELGIPTHVVQDAGRTQVAAGSRTVLALGPAPKNLIDAVSGHLKLY